MSRTRIPLPSLVHGVSQLNAAERQPVHALASDNCWPTVEAGDQKRPPTIHVAKIRASAFADCYCHGIDRGTGERYMALMRHGATTDNMLVFDTAGAVYVVKKNSSAAVGNLVYTSPDYSTNCDFIYLATGSAPSRNIRALSVLDYTFIANRSQPVTMSNSTTTAAPTTVAHVFVRQGAFSAKYTVKIKNSGGTTWTINAATHQSILVDYPISGAIEGYDVFDTVLANPPAGGRKSSVKTSDIASMLLVKLGGGPAAAGTYGSNVVTGALGAEFVTSQVGSVLKIVSNNGPITVFEVTTSQGDQLAFGIQNEIDSFDKLPLIFTHDYVVKVKGDTLADEDDFWVKFTADAGSGFGKGTWSETAKPGITHKWVYTPSSFHPHALVRRTSTEAGTITNPVVGNSGKFFTFEPINLGERLVGDTTSNPNPSFVSVTGTFQPSGGGGTDVAFPVVRNVQDVAWFANRLVLLCDNFISASEQGSYFNFFRTTVRSLPDSDPIDAALNSDRTTILHSAIPFTGKLILFSAESQHQFLGAPNLTPATVEAAQVSRYRSSNAVRPVAYEDGIIFTKVLGSFMTLDALVQSPTAESSFTSNDLSVHVPKYIPGTAKQIETTTDSSVIAVLADGALDAVYILKQHREGDQVIQSAWLRFVIDNATIRGIQFFDNKLYICSERTANAVTELFLEYIDLSVGVSDNGNNYWTMLDRRATPTTLANVGADTDVTMPYNLETAAVMEIVNLTTGTRYVESSRTGIDKFRVTGINLNGATCVAGVKYTSTHSFHKPQVQINEQNGKKLILDSTAAVLGLALRYENTSYFKVVVGSATKAVAGNGTTYVSTASPAQPTSGSVFIGVGGRLDSPFAVSVQNDSPFPHTLVSGEWLMNVNVRSRAIQ